MPYVYKPLKELLAERKAQREREAAARREAVRKGKVAWRALRDAKQRALGHAARLGRAMAEAGGDRVFSMRILEGSFTHDEWKANWVAQQRTRQPGYNNRGARRRGRSLF